MDLHSDDYDTMMTKLPWSSQSNEGCDNDLAAFYIISFGICYFQGVVTLGTLQDCAFKWVNVIVAILMQTTFDGFASNGWKEMQVWIWKKVLISCLLAWIFNCNHYLMPVLFCRKYCYNNNLNT